MRRRMLGQMADMARADTAMLAVKYADEPVPFWPVDFPSTLEELGVATP